MAATGCGGEAGKPAPAKTTAAPKESAATPAAAASMADPRAAAAAGKVGFGAGCPFPATFSTPARWKPVDASGTGTVVGSGIRLVCEIDGKPAGVVGFIRVWVRTPDATPPAALGRAFVNGWATKATELRSRDLPIAGAPGAELQFRQAGTLNRVFVVALPAAVVIVNWGGTDDEEHVSGLPAYILARSTIKALDEA